MLKNTLLLISILLLSSCAERGYTLTTNKDLHTVSAERIEDITYKTDDFNITNTTIEDQEIRNNGLKKSTIFKKMKKDVKKVQIQNAKKEKKKSIIYKEKKKIKKIESTQEPIQKLSKSPVDTSDEEERRLLKEAKKSKELREARLREASKIKTSFENRQSVQIKKIPSKIIKKDSSDISIVPKNILRKTKLNKQKALEEEKHILELKEKHRQNSIKEAEIKRQNILATEKRRQNAIQKKTTNVIENRVKHNITSTQPLSFKEIDKVYHKFGSSEVHGHVIYLNGSGQEIKLTQTKVYLLPVSAKLNNWFKNYYLKNKMGSTNTIVNFLNKTNLNIQKNFEFFGVPVGSYYVIIESETTQNKKIYIAKKIQVEKYKKVMAVFSKKL